MITKSVIEKISKEEAFERLKKTRLPLIGTSIVINKSCKDYYYDEFERYKEEIGLQDWMTVLRNTSKNSEEDIEIAIELMQRAGWHTAHSIVSNLHDCENAIQEGKDYSLQLTRGRLKDGKMVNVFFLKNRGNDAILENEDGKQWEFKNQLDFEKLMDEYQIPIVL